MMSIVISRINEKFNRKDNKQLEAIDWYGQRIDVSHDDELRLIREHHRDEEKEHAAMVLEWLRRNDPALDGHLQTYLYQKGSITEREEQSEGADEGSAQKKPSSDGSLGIGSLKAKAS